jgi:hypothetical protein
VWHQYPLVPDFELVAEPLEVPENAVNPLVLNGKVWKFVITVGLHKASWNSAFDS